MRLSDHTFQECLSLSGCVDRQGNLESKERKNGVREARQRAGTSTAELSSATGPAFVPVRVCVCTRKERTRELHIRSIVLKNCWALPAAAAAAVIYVPVRVV